MHTQKTEARKQGGEEPNKVSAEAGDCENERSKQTDRKQKDERSQGNVGLTIRQKDRGAEGHERYWRAERKNCVGNRGAEGRK